MNRKNTFTRASLIAATSYLTVNTVPQAQDIHFTQFTAAPLTVNPAFTGNFDGQWRATAIYRTQCKEVSPQAYQTYGASFDMPIIQDLTIDDYLAAGCTAF